MRSSSSKGQFQRRVPADVLRIAHGKPIAFSLPKSHAGGERIIVSAKIGNEVMFSLRQPMQSALHTLGRSIRRPTCKRRPAIQTAFEAVNWIWIRYVFAIRRSSSLLPRFFR